MTWRLPLALLLPFATCGVQWLLWDYIRPHTWVLFATAFLGAWIGGFWGGIGATSVSAVLVWYVFMPPQFSFTLQDRSSLFSVVVFLAMGFLFARLLERLRLAQESSDTRFEVTFDQAAVGFALVAIGGKFQRVNDRLCTMLGYSREELLEKTVADITHPDDRPASRESVDQLLRGERSSFVLEERHVRKDGTPIWSLSSIALVRNVSGGPDYYVAVVQDVQANKEAEAALRRSERSYRELVESANSAILHWSPDGAVTFINEYAQRLFGWSAEEIIGQPVGVLVPDQESNGSDGTGVVADVAARPERYLHCVNENICRDGRRLWMSWTNRAIRDERGVVTGILAIGNDITELKHAEEELKRRNAELELFDRAAVGRELTMIELKRKANDLARELGREPPFDLSFARDGRPNDGDAPR